MKFNWTKLLTNAITLFFLSFFLSLLVFLGSSECLIVVLAIVFYLFCAWTDKVFGHSTVSQEVYEVAARPVVKAAMEGVNGMIPFS